MYTARQVQERALQIAEGAIVVLRDKGWVQKWYAHDARGQTCWATSPDAACFCSLGAMTRARIDAELPSDELTQIARDLIDAEFRDLHPEFTSMATWNDEPLRTKDEVLNMFGAITTSIKDKLNDTEA